MEITVHITEQSFCCPPANGRISHNVWLKNITPPPSPTRTENFLLLSRELQEDVSNRNSGCSLEHCADLLAYSFCPKHAHKSWWVAVSTGFVGKIGFRLRMTWQQALESDGSCFWNYYRVFVQNGREDTTYLLCFKFSIEVSLQSGNDSEIFMCYEH